MALQHHEFRLRDAERLQLYVQAGMAEREMQSASLKEAELACCRLELEAKEHAERPARAEAERDAAPTRQQWPSWRLKGPLIPEHRWSLSLSRFKML